MRPLETLPNLGPKSSEWLRSTGIASIEDLEQIGAVGAYRLVKSQQTSVSLNLLWALAAGLKGHHWRDLPPSEKERLRHDAEA